VVVIPPNKPCIRTDQPDVLYTHREARNRAVVEEVSRVHASGRPILVGTVSVTESEHLATELTRSGVSCQVLNAKNDEQEAAIIADAGAVGAVTISTNMAGRGTDIRLGGRDEGESARVVSLGGLYVIGTNRHDSVRIDDQLRGRAGRQGDPGSSRFFVSLEDDLLQRYGVDTLIPAPLMPRRSDMPVDSSVLRREVNRIQRIVEGENLDIRRRLYSYSAIIEQQRRLIAEWRQAVLEDGTVPSLLAERCAPRWTRLGLEVGDRVLREVERHLTLIMIDRCWSDYLTEMQAVRDEIHLVALDGRTPLVEFYRAGIAAFERLETHIDHEVVATFESLEVTADGVDWEQVGLRGPSATWTYLVNDNVFAGNVLRTMANRASIGLWGTLLLWPVLFAWGLYLHWRRWRRGKAADSTS
jgi:preprotein translocase subunit SecA